MSRDQRSENGLGLPQDPGPHMRTQTSSAEPVPAAGLGHTGRERRLQAARRPRDQASSPMHLLGTMGLWVHAGRLPAGSQRFLSARRWAQWEREVGNTTGRAAGGGLLGQRAAALRQAQLPVSSKGREEPAGRGAGVAVAPAVCCGRRLCSQQLLSALPRHREHSPGKG